ncbi:MAG: hypothetical protein KIS72_07140, partial [Luteimonas sp.]|nr:hypothetical protein [Luteimonas sp.]
TAIASFSIQRIKRFWQVINFIARRYAGVLPVIFIEKRRVLAVRTKVDVLLLSVLSSREVALVICYVKTAVAAAELSGPNRLRALPSHKFSPVP